LICGREDSNL